MLNLMKVIQILNFYEKKLCYFDNMFSGISLLILFRSNFNIRAMNTREVV